MLLGFLIVVLLVVSTVLWSRHYLSRKAAQFSPVSSTIQPSIELSALPGLRFLWSSIKAKKSAKELQLQFLNEGLLKKDLSVALFGVYALTVTHPEDLKKVLTTTDFDKERSPVVGKYGHFKEVLGDSLVATGGEPGWHHRKALNPAFSFNRVKGMIPLFIRTTERMMELWEKFDLKQSIDIFTVFRNFTFDVLGLTSFGYDFKAMTGQLTEQKQNLDHAFAGLRSPLDFIFRGLPYKLPTQANKELKYATAQSKKLILDVINKRMEDRKHNVKSSSDVDLLDLILDAANTEEGKQYALTTQQIVKDMFLFFLAGHETSAGTLTSAFYYLAKNPKYQDMLVDEVTKVLGNNGRVTEENVKDFKFISAILKETLRLNPPIFPVGRRMATKDTELAGVRIPKGTRVIANLTRAHFSEEFWKDPMTFNPHRFLDEEGSDSTQRVPFFAFSAGPRICIGHKFSVTEMTVAMAMIVQKYRWQLPEGFVWVDDPLSITTSPKGGLPVLLEKRVHV